MNADEFLEKLEKIIGAVQDVAQNIPMMKFIEHLIRMLMITTVMRALYKMIMEKENMKIFQWSVGQDSCTLTMPI